MESTASGAPAWSIYVALTVLCWGSYGVLLHTGQVAMEDPENGRYKAFLFVGLAYVLTAVLAPALALWLKGADWDMTSSGASWSLIAGVAGAVGAFSVLLAFGAKGSPAVVARRRAPGGEHGRGGPAGVGRRGWAAVASGARRGGSPC